METVAATGALPEDEFAGLADAWAADPDRQHDLADLLREEHPVYDQRGTVAIVRMRGWVLLALARAGASDGALLFILDELENGNDPYLMAAAARALRSSSARLPSFGPLVLRAIARIRSRDEPVCFDEYGAYATSSTGATAVGELLQTLVWMGAQAGSVIRDIEALAAPGGGLTEGKRQLARRAVEAIRAAAIADAGPVDCCALPSLGQRWSLAAPLRVSAAALAAVEFEDHDGHELTFSECFQGRPTIVAFFYSRCDNPAKCSLTITRLAQVQRMLDARGLADRIQTAAITYDPEYDRPERLRGYGRNRGWQPGPGHRLLRATRGMDVLRRHFALGVNFVASLVNRHRVEVHILDAEGRIARSFVRLRWEEAELVDQAKQVLEEGWLEEGRLEEGRPVHSASQADTAVVALAPALAKPSASTLPGALAAMGVAFFPKCPVCWAAYMSSLGIAGAEAIPYEPWLQPLLGVVMLLNLASLWVRGRATGSRYAWLIAAAGVAAIALSKAAPEWESVAPWGVGLMVAGSLASALAGTRWLFPWPRLVRRAEASASADR